MDASTPIKLSELTAKIRDTLNRSFANQSYWVFADITNYSFKSDKNYHYFELVEKGDLGMVTRINAAAWEKVTCISGNLKNQPDSIQKWNLCSGQSRPWNIISCTD